VRKMRKASRSEISQSFRFLVRCGAPAFRICHPVGQRRRHLPSQALRLPVDSDGHRRVLFHALLTSSEVSHRSPGRSIDRRVSAPATMPTIASHQRGADAPPLMAAMIATGPPDQREGAVRASHRRAAGTAARPYAPLSTSHEVTRVMEKAQETVERIACKTAASTTDTHRGPADILETTSDR
jgi:hypothetical protein